MTHDQKGEPKIRIDNISYAYDGKSALRDVTLDVLPNAITVLFGPAGGGKTTLLRLINRLNDLVEGTQMSGRILLDGQDIYAPGAAVASLRRRVGMVFALPLPLPGTVRVTIASVTAAPVASVTVIVAANSGAGNSSRTATM